MKNQPGNANTESLASMATKKPAKKRIQPYNTARRISGPCAAERHNKCFKLNCPCECHKGGR